MKLEEEEEEEEEEDEEEEEQREDGKWMRKNRMFGVYQDGILLQNVKQPDRVSFRSPGELPRLFMHVNLSSSGSLRPNVSRTTFESAAKAWDKSIWSAIENRLRETHFPLALNKTPAERLYHIGWLSAVFNLDSDTIERVVPADKMVTLWLMSNSEVVVREKVFSSGEELPLLPRESKQLFIKLVTELWGLPNDSVVKLEWNGPASLGPPLRLSQIFVTPTTVSQPVDAILELLLYRNMKYLIEVRLQFLEPPEGQSSLIMQSVYVPDPVPKDNSDKASDSSKRRTYLKRPDVSKALEAALNDPSHLEPQLRKLVYNAIQCAIPVSFSAPFSKRFLCSTALNSLHAYGNAVLRCIVACAIAERDERLPKSELQKLGNLQRAYTTLLRSSPSDTIFLDRILPIQKTEIHEFATRLFGIVEDYKLIDDFTRPPRPDVSELVPNILGEFLSEADFRPGIEFGDLSLLKGAFGKLITEWPLPKRETYPKETTEISEKKGC